MGQAGAPLRVYLTGRVRAEAGEVLIDERDLPGRQGRLALALLVAERDRAVSREELAEELWGEDLPAAWEPGLRALLSKLRRTLEPAGLPTEALAHAFGCYQLRLPVDAWVDVEAAGDAVHRAEVALAAGDPHEAYGWTYVGYHITRRPFLVGEDGPWASGFRWRLQGLRLRVLDCVVECTTATGELAEAVRAAEEALALDPLREATYQRYMRALATAGSRAEALRVWERCRRVLADELGTSPSPHTEAVYLDILRAD
jgi:SARP family transcriptional regulator, regulator of embCAB operon